MRLDLTHQNLLLRAAPRGNRPQLDGKLKRISFEVGQQIWLAGADIPYALFPLRGVVSLRLPDSSRKQVEIALVGREGFAPLSLFLGAEKTGLIAIGTTPGEAVIMAPGVFRECLGNANFKAAVQGYVRMRIVMLSRLLVCNRIHSIDQLLIGRLLLIQDRTQADSFHLSQEFLSSILGVRKASIAAASARLRDQDVIQSDRRGRLTIFNRDRLEELACSCYHAIKAEFDKFAKTLGGF